jgi:hypothetical protein
MTGTDKIRGSLNQRGGPLGERHENLKFGTNEYDDPTRTEVEGRGTFWNELERQELRRSQTEPLPEEWTPWKDVSALLAMSNVEDG